MKIKPLAEERNGSKGEHDSELARALESYLAHLEAGRRPDPRKLIDQHPAVADRLRACLASLQFVSQAALEVSGDGRQSAVYAGETPGAGVLGDFRLVREVGRGGMGVVYEAQQVSLARRVALKILPFAAVVDPRQVARFKNEAQAAAQLDHPHIVDVIAIGCERGVHYFAMRYIDGLTLAQVIGRLRGGNTGNGKKGERGKGEGSQEKSEFGGRKLEDDARSAGASEGTMAFTPDPEIPSSPPPLLPSSPPAFSSAAFNPQSAIHDSQFPTAPIAGLSTDPGTNRREFFRSAAALVVPVAEALDHAHEVGVVHRDMKPSNLMLDAHGKIWITDFGLARINSHPDMTMSGDLIGTLRYMSPEQALAKRVPIDHRTDVYSLGATLYELLTLQPVFDGRDKQELLRQIAFEEPRPPRRVDRSIAPELETIVLKALEKNPADRYATAGDLADDLRRFLDQRPIRARRPSLAGRAMKWSRRHTAVVTAAACILFVTAVALGVSTWRIGTALTTAQKAAESETQARLAEAVQRRQAETVAGLLESVFTRLDPAAERKGGPSVVEQLVSQLDQIGETLEKDYAGEPLVRARLQHALGQAHLGLGEAAKAVELFEKANAQREAKLGPEHPDTLDSMGGLALAYWMAGDLVHSVPLFEECLRLQRVKLGPDHASTLSTMANLAVSYRDAGRLDEAMPLFEQALAKGKETLGPDHPQMLVWMSDLADAYRRDAAMLEKAVPLLEPTLEKQKSKLGPDHPDTLRSMGKLAGAYQGASRVDAALPLFEETVQKQKAKLGPDHRDTLISMGNLAAAYHYAGQLDKALPLFEETLEKQKAKLGPDHPDTLQGMAKLAGAYRDAGQLDKALPLFEQTVEKMKAKLGPDHADTLHTMWLLSLCYQATAQCDRALPLVEHVLESRRAKLGPDHPHTLHAMNAMGKAYHEAAQFDKALAVHEQALEKWKAKLDDVQTLYSMNNLAVAYMATGQLEKAVPLLEETLEEKKAKRGPDDPDTLTTMSNLAAAYKAAGQLDKALPLSEEVLEKQKAKLGPDHPDTLVSMNNLATVYMNTGQLDKALAMHEQALEKMKANLAPDHPFTLSSMNNLALAYQRVGRLDKALPLFEETVEIEKAKLGPENPNTLISMGNLAAAYDEIGRLDEAHQLFEETLEKQKARLGPDHPNTLLTMDHMATAYVRTGEFAKAETINRESLRQVTQRFGDDDLRSAAQMAALALCLLRQMKYAEAEPLARQCLQVREAQAADEWTTFNTRSLLGGSLLGQKGYADAEPLLLAGYEGMQSREERIPPPAKVRLTEALERLVQLYDQWGKPAQSAKWRGELEAIEHANATRQTTGASSHHNGAMKPDAVKPTKGPDEPLEPESESADPTDKERQP